MRAHLQARVAVDLALTRLARSSQSLYELGFEFRRIATETAEVIKQSLADHDLIARTISQRKPELAEKAFRLHLDHVRATTIQAQSTLEKWQCARSKQLPAATSACELSGTQTKKARKHHGN